VESIQRNLRQEERTDDQFCATGLVPLDELYGYDIPDEIKTTSPCLPRKTGYVS